MILKVLWWSYKAIARLTSALPGQLFAKMCQAKTHSISVLGDVPDDDHVALHLESLTRSSTLIGDIVVV